MTTATPRTMTRLLGITTIALVTSLLPGTAAAQDAPDESEKGFFLGPVNITPRIGWTTTYDDNVFRIHENPVADTVSTVSGSSSFQMQARRLSVTGNASAAYVHYTNLLRERGPNFGSSVKVGLIDARISPYASASYATTLDRVNPEIDSTPRSKNSSVTIGSIFEFSDRSSFDVSATRGHNTYDYTDFEDGVNLAVALNRASDHYAATFRQGMTPLTRLTFSGELSRELFDVSSYRNAREARLSAGFQSDGFVRGHARAGLRMMRPSDPAVPEVRGLFVSVGTSMTLVDRFQIGITAGHDTEPSYRDAIAYYGASNYGVVVNYALRRSVDLHGAARLIVADYREGHSAQLPSAQQYGVERETRYESGVRFDLGQLMSIDVTGSYATRTAAVPDHRFKGMAISAGVSHAF